MSILDYQEAGAAVLALLADTGRQLLYVITRKKRLPVGALTDQIEKMGVDAVGIVGLLGLLLGTTLAFQGIVLLQRFGAGVFVADMIGISMVREFGPMMTAIILTGRTGAAIAAELGTMKVRDELDALTTMGVSPTRFLLLPRLLALSIVQPALSLMSMFLGIGGGMIIAALVLHLPPDLFWDRIVARITFGDFLHGMGKSLTFAWIIGFTGSHLGMRASANSTSVGAATTRTVVVSVFFIIVVDLEIMGSTRQASENLVATTAEMHALVAENRKSLKTSLDTVAVATKSAQDLMDNQVVPMVANANDLIGDMRGVVHSNENVLQSAMADIRQASRSFKDLAREVKEKPSRLLFSATQPERKLP